MKNKFIKQVKCPDISYFYLFRFIFVSVNKKHDFDDKLNSNHKLTSHFLFFMA